MGTIQQLKDKTIIRMSVDEVLTTRVSADKDITFTLAEMIWKFGQMKAKQKGIELPYSVIETTFDPVKAEFVVIFWNGMQ